MPNKDYSEFPEEERKDDNWEKIVSAIVVDKEYTTDQANMDREQKDFDAALSLLTCDREEKEYDWQSDIFIPDFPSIVWTQIGELVVQYFSKWEKIDCPPSTSDLMDQLKSKAAKDFLNYHFNQPYMHYFQKFVRHQVLNKLGGWVVLKLRYESDVEIRQTGVRNVPMETGFDIYGNPIEDSEYPAKMKIVQEPVTEKVIHVDRPNFDVWSPNDVFMDNKYCYSLQEKDHVIFRSEQKLSQLKKDEEICQYFNLDLLEQDTETDTEKKGYNKKDKTGDKYNRVIQKWNPDIETLERWGMWPVVVTPDMQVINGIDEDGNMVDGAIWMPMIITVANHKKTKVLIRFQPNIPEFGGLGFVPAVRIMCYIHPTKDRGMSDATYGRELQIGINDTFNMNNDRVMLATYPTLKVKKYDADIEWDSLFFAPEHAMEMGNMDSVQEFQWDSDITGGLVQQDMLTKKLQQVLATWTHDMGGLPDKKTPVTTTVMAEQKSTIRNSLNSLTVEHTGLQEFYAMFLEMSGMFMQPETLFEVLGDRAIWFDPKHQYNFVPVSTSIMTEQGKDTRIQRLLQMFQYLVALPNPNTFMLANLILSEIFELMGKEYSQYSKSLLDPSAPHPQLLEAMVRMNNAGQGGTQGKQKAKKGNKPARQNQYGNQQTPQEQSMRMFGTATGGGRM